MKAAQRQGKEVSGVLLHAFRRDSEELCGSPDRIFEGELSHLAQLPDRFGWDELLTLYGRLEALGASFEHCGQTATQVPALRRALRIVSLTASPLQVMMVGAPFVLRRLFSHLPMEQEVLPNGQLRSTITIPQEYADSNAFFETAYGLLRGIFALLGVPSTTIELSREDHRGTFLFTLPRSRTWWERCLGLIRWRAFGLGALREAAERENLLNERNQQLEAALQVKQRFLAILSHELRTPLNGIVGAATVIRDAERGPVRDQFLQELDESCARLLRVVGGIVDLSQLEDTHCTPIPQDCLIRSCIAEAVEVAERKARAKDLRFEVQIGSSVPERIAIDVQRVQGLLDHLCDNAVKFTNSGGCRVRVEARDEEPCPLLEIAIEDTGIGIAAQDQKRIFDMFTQVDDSSERRHQGAGLGLALCQRTAALLGGTLEVESEPGRGTTFQLRLPFLHPKAAIPHVRSVPATDSRAVLVVDDSRANRILLTHLLGKLNWEIDQAENGREAVQKASARRYRVIFMDCEMPVLDGFEATRTLRLQGDDTPIVAVTAYVSDDARMRCQRVGMNQFLGKPISPTQIRAAMLQWTGQEDGISS